MYFPCFPFCITVTKTHKNCFYNYKSFKPALGPQFGETYVTCTTVYILLPKIQMRPSISSGRFLSGSHCHCFSGPATQFVPRHLQLSWVTNNNLASWVLCSSLNKVKSVSVKKALLGITSIYIFTVPVHRRMGYSMDLLYQTDAALFQHWDVQL